MAEDLNEGGEKKPARRSKFFKKIPKEFLFSPGGFILVFVAVCFEALDLLLPGGSLTIEIVPDLIFAILLILIARVPISSTILPFLIERIPIISDILPTWLIRLFM